MEELDAQDKMGFSADRHKDMSYGIVQSQTTASMFGSSFMSDQSSQGINGFNFFRLIFLALHFCDNSI